MDDVYKEILVQRKATGADKVKKYGAVGLIAFVFAFGLVFFPPMILAGIVLAVLAWYLVFPNLDLEYEYLYVNGDIDIDKILAKTRRKKVASYDKGHLEIMAPEGSDQLSEYVKGTRVKDFTSRDPKEKAWVLVYTGDNGPEAVRLELSEEIAKDMRRYAPRKVFFE